MIQIDSKKLSVRYANDDERSVLKMIPFKVDVAYAADFDI